MTDPQDPDTAAIPESWDRNARWLRLLYVIVFAILFRIGDTVLGIAALLQALWILVTGRRNDLIAGFGVDLARWLAAVARFQSAASDEKPFPWRPWP
ncbi:DUF4389 domain-containing protein [Pseudooceanicola sp.]|uniref:DUF4389 domain-containing protein n=1 Tax=Pseudooceanicola sp. TaxID=1914328 RepID=UPI0026241CED|nr:DUF4389 domain-containing protein [Pseudooceanicola sp.]MDF1853930.1 DUF4389 domain-containing protein [Pseudooceanicola sp.]